MIVGIEGRDDLVRDCSSGAILNTNQIQYENYLQRRKAAKLQKEQAGSQSEQIKNLEAELAALKELVTKLVAR